MDSSTVCTINGISFVPANEGLTCGIQAVDLESGRTSDGNMHRNMVGTKYKYEITMPPVHSNDPIGYSETTVSGQTVRTDKYMRDLLRALMPQEFQATMPDPMYTTDTEGNPVPKTGTFYVGDRSMPVYNFSLDLWNSWKFDIIEI